MTPLSEVQWWCVADGEPWSGAWRGYPGVWLFVGLLAATLAWLHRREGGGGPAARRRADGRERRRLAASTGAVLLLWLTLDWPVGPLGTGYLASVHALQFLSLACVVPMLLLAGVGGRATDAVARRPMVNAVVFALTVAATHVPAVVDALMATQGGAMAIDLAWLASGLLFWWPVVRGSPAPRWSAPPARMLYVFAGTQPHLLIAVWLLVGEFPHYAIYELAPRALPLGALLDQQLAGAVMLVGMLPIVFGTISVLYFRWARSAAVAER